MVPGVVRLLSSGSAAAALRQRWPVVVVAILFLAGLTDASLLAADQPAPLGLRAEARGSDLVVAYVVPAGLASDVGVRPGDAILQVDGAPASARDGDRIPGARTATILANDETLIELRAESSPFLRAPLQRVAFLVTAWAFVLVGGAVFVLATDVEAAGLLLAMSTSAASALTVAIATAARPAWGLSAEYVSVLTFALSTLLFFLRFPLRRDRTPAGRRALRASLVATIAVLIGYAWAFASGQGGYTQLRQAAFGLVGVELLAALGLALWPAGGSGRSLSPLLALGTAAGLGPFTVLSLAPSLLGRDYLVDPEIAILGLAALPVSLGAAILRGDVPGITRLVRRGSIALLVWTLLLAASAETAAWVYAQGGWSHPPPSPAWLAIEVALIVAIFPFLQARLRRSLEGWLLRDSYDYAAALERLSSEVTQLTNTEAITSHVLSRLGRLLDLAWSSLELDGKRHLWGAPVSTGPPAARVPLVADGRRLGVLALGPKRHDVELSAEDVALVRTFAPLLATVLQNVHLVERLAEQVSELRDRELALTELSARLMRVQEEERRRVALDLHDDPLQRAILLARSMREGAQAGAAETWRQALDDVIDGLRRICTGLRPPALDDLGLARAIEGLLRDVRARSDLRATLRASMEAEPGRRLHPDLETALFRVAQEALNNCLRHAQATQVEVLLCVDRDTVHLRVMDDGIGTEPSSPQGGRFGILGMRERLRPWGGEVLLESPPAGGTILSVAVRTGVA